jgi:hypothetical protein
MKQFWVLRGIARQKYDGTRKTDAGVAGRTARANKKAACWV